MFRRFRKEKEKIHMPETNILIADVGSLELKKVKVKDSVTLDLNGNWIYNGTNPVVFSIDMFSLFNRTLDKMIASLLFGRKRLCRTYFMLKHEPLTRRIFTNDNDLSEIIDKDLKQQIISKYQITQIDNNELKGKRKIIDVTDIEAMKKIVKEAVLSNLLQEYWRTARARTIKEWLPWIICAIVSITGFGALTLAIFMMG